MPEEVDRDLAFMIAGGGLVLLVIGGLFGSETIQGLGLAALMIGLALVAFIAGGFSFN